MGGFARRLRESWRHHGAAWRTFGAFEARFEASWNRVEGILGIILVRLSRHVVVKDWLGEVESMYFYDKVSRPQVELA